MVARVRSELAELAVTGYKNDEGLTLDAWMLDPTQRGGGRLLGYDLGSWPGAQAYSSVAGSAEWIASLCMFGAYPSPRELVSVEYMTMLSLIQEDEAFRLALVSAYDLGSWPGAQALLRGLI